MLLPLLILHNHNFRHVHILRLLVSKLPTQHSFDSEFEFIDLLVHVVHLVHVEVSQVAEPFLHLTQHLLHQPCEILRVVDILVLVAFHNLIIICLRFLYVRRFNSSR